MATKKAITQSKAYGVLIAPRVTEKAAIVSENGVYTFMVAPTATKVAIAHAIKELYNVLPTKVAIVRVPAKTKMRRGIAGVVGATKKAYVTLPKGKTIEFI